MRDYLRAPGLARPLGVTLERVPGERDDGDLAGERVVLDSARRLPTVDHRKRQVHHHEVGQLGASHLDGLGAVPCLDDVQPRVAEELRVHRARVRVAVDEQDAETQSLREGRLGC